MNDELEKREPHVRVPREQAGCLCGAARHDGLRLQVVRRIGCVCQRQRQHVAHNMSKHKESPR